jgi:hypothetical protein
MAVVAVAILISFHLKNEASELEKKVALPFGLIFWFLGMACLMSGLNNYIKTVNRYSRRQALVQSGVATQVVRKSIIGRSETGNTRLTVFEGIYGGSVRDHCGLCLVSVH